MSIAVLTRTDQVVGQFGDYLAEILRAEGFADQTVIPFTDPDLPELTDHDAVVVARLRPTKAQVTALLGYARRGGRLVIIRPSYLFAVELGLAPTHSMIDPAYVGVRGDHPVGAGLTGEPFETHVPADGYQPDALPDGARVPAELRLDPDTGTELPAIIELPYGEGRVIVFSYDLAKAVSLIRQGDPGRVGGHGLEAGEPYRMQDLLTGYADPRCWHLPQADLHAMLLINAVHRVARTAQPRLWYYPEATTRSTLVLDSDDDWSAPEHFDALIESVEDHGGKITIYLMLGGEQRTIATPDKVAAWRERGHSFGIHHNAFDPSLGGEDQEEVIEQVVRHDIAEFAELYGGVPVTNRNHCLGWKGYVDLPKVYAELGVTMDLNANNAGPSWLAYLTGSARPLRVVDTDGTVIDCFQQATQAYDDLGIKELLSSDAEGQAALVRQLIIDKVDRYFSPLSMLSHPVSFATYSSDFQNRCWRAARELGLPLWSAAEWAEFVRTRDAARIDRATWTDDAFSCRVRGRSPRGSFAITLPLPAGRAAGATVDGQPVELTELDVFGWPSVVINVPIAADHDQDRELRLQLR
ncbi:hypothetical protein [Microlunatus sp. GCM10028923]|uniref:hypothetical protein n=1 Tax=Microlunatus sp. GCM10028923 TaxID=3273400 RepID=UPI0036092B22